MSLHEGLTDITWVPSGSTECTTVATINVKFTDISGFPDKWARGRQKFVFGAETNNF